MLVATRLGDDYQIPAQRQEDHERRALRLAAAWTDFDTVEHIAGEIIERFGHIDARDLGVLRLHKQPLFAALQTTAVVTYIRPFIENGGIGRTDPRYSTYSKREWNRLHSEMFVWQHRLTGEGSGNERQFMTAPHDARNPASGKFVIGEASAVLEPMNQFTHLRSMCADRKALIWPALQETLMACYPSLRHPVLLNLRG